MQAAWLLSVCSICGSEYPENRGKPRIASKKLLMVLFKSKLPVLGFSVSESFRNVNNSPFHIKRN